MTYIFIVVLMLPWVVAQAQTPGASDVQAGKEIWEGYFNLENDQQALPRHSRRGQVDLRPLSPVIN